MEEELSPVLRGVPQGKGVLYPPTFAQCECYCSSFVTPVCADKKEKTTLKERPHA